MKKVNKIISVVLVFTMILTVLPINIFAAVGSYTASLGATSIKVGKTTSVKIKCTKAAGKFTISSSYTAVATVSTSATWVDNGTMDNAITVKGISKGTATITITPVDVSDTEYNLLTTPKYLTITVKEEQKTNTNTNSSTKNNSKVEEQDKKVKSSDATLKSLTIKDEEIKFKPSTTKYTLNVDNDVTSLDITAKANNSKATVKITGNKDFEVGENIVKITVRAEDGTSKVYTITVTRAEEKQDEPEQVKGTAPLLDLKVKNYTINEKFNASRTTYTVDVVNEKNVELEYVLGNKDSIVEITGNNNLQVGLNKVQLKVTEPNGTVTVYTVNVNNTNVVEENNNLWLIIIIILSILVIIETIYIIAKNRKERR